MAELASFARMATLACGPRGEASECGALGARGEPNAPAWPRASQFEELAPRARRHTHRCRKYLAITRSISYRPPSPTVNVGGRSDKFYLAAIFSDAPTLNLGGAGCSLIVSAYRLTCQLPPSLASAMRDSAGKGSCETIGQEDAGHGDGDRQVRFARLRRHVRPAPHARLCQMHRVRDASQVRQVCQVAKWARPHSLALMRANARIHPRHIFRVSLASLVSSHRFASCARPPPSGHVLARRPPESCILHHICILLASLVPSLPIFYILQVSLVEKRESLYYIIFFF